MEPSAVSSCSRMSSLHASGSSERRKDVLLRIDPHLTSYASPNRGDFEELPENFLETVSPQQNGGGGEFGAADRPPSADLGGDPRYAGADHLNLSPVPRDSTLLLRAGTHGRQQLDVCRPLQYIKEESPPPAYHHHHRVAEFEPVYLHGASYEDQLGCGSAHASRSDSPLSSELSTSATALSTEVSAPEPPPAPLNKRIRTPARPRTPPLEPPRKSKNAPVSQHAQQQQQQAVDDSLDPLNAEIDDQIYIDTKDLCKRVAYELKQHSIPQATFAEKILCRSQGTLSDLLRNPKPWNRLKSGRETFRRMYNWIQQPLGVRLAILDMRKENTGSLSPHSTVSASNNKTRSRPVSSSDENFQSQKRPRLVFSDIQKRTLQAIFKETQRPSREMQQTIADHLKLDMSTVSNFFMNARRRSRNGTASSDLPAPYQQVKQITPPPDADMPRKLNKLQQRLSLDSGDETSPAGSARTNSRPRTRPLKTEQRQIRIKSECPEEETEDEKPPLADGQAQP